MDGIVQVCQGVNGQPLTKIRSSEAKCCLCHSETKMTPMENLLTISN